MVAKLLIIIPSFVAAGGTERMVAELSNLLAREHDVVVCSFDGAGARPKFPINCSFVPLGDSRRLPLPLRWMTYAGQARRLRALKRRLGTELSISNLWRADLISFLSAGPDRKIALAHINVVGNPTNRTLLRLRRLVGAVYRRFSAVVTVSDALAAELTALYRLKRDRVQPIANFVSGSSTGRAGSASPKRTLLWCGRFVPEKNVEALVPIFTEVHGACPWTELVLVGDGPTRDKVFKAVTAAGLNQGNSPAVAFAGRVEDAREIMAGADLLLLPSRAEGLPMVVLEALASGVPVIAADCPSGGMCQALGAGTPHDPSRSPERTSCGVLLPVPEAGDERAQKAWVDEIVTLLKENDRLGAMRAGAIRRAEAFGPRPALEQWRALIKKVMA